MKEITDFITSVITAGLIGLLLTVVEGAVCFGLGGFVGFLSDKLKIGMHMTFACFAAYVAAAFFTSGGVRFGVILMAFFLFFRCITLLRLIPIPPALSSRLTAKFERRVVSASFAPLPAIIAMRFTAFDHPFALVLAVSVIIVIFTKCRSMAYYKRICSSAWDNGAVSTRTIRRWATMRGDKQKKGEAKKFLLITDLADRLSASGELSVWTGMQERYYFSNKYFASFERRLREKLASQPFFFADELLRDKTFFIPFTALDLEIFINERCPEVLTGHRDNKDIYCVADAQTGGGLCECCKRHSDSLIRTENGNYCSDACMKLMFRLTGMSRRRPDYLPAIEAPDSTRTDAFSSVAPCRFGATAQETVSMLLESGDWQPKDAEKHVRLLEAPADQHEKASRLVREKLGADIAFPSLLNLTQARNMARAGVSPSLGFDDSDCVICLNPRGITAELLDSRGMSSSIPTLDDPQGERKGGGRMAAMMTSDVLEGYLKKVLASGARNGASAGVGIGLASMCVFQYRDFIDYFSGCITGKQLARNLAGAGVGAVAGGIVGASLGIVPGMLVGSLAGSITDSIVEKISLSDEQTARLVLEKELRLLSRDWLLSPEDISAVTQVLSSMDMKSLSFDLVKAPDRYSFAARLMLPTIISLVKRHAGTDNQAALLAAGK